MSIVFREFVWDAPGRGKRSAVSKSKKNVMATRKTL